MVERASALEGHYQTGRFGAEGDAGVTLTEVRDLVLHQVAAWPETMAAAGAKAAKAVGAKSAPGPGAASVGPKGVLLRIEPLKWWLFGAEVPELTAAEGATLDLSHARTHLRVSGPDAATLLNRDLPIDLRDASFPVGSVAASVFHHVGITVWRSDAGYDLLVPRGFALSLWEVLAEGAAQFGGEVV